MDSNGWCHFPASVLLLKVTSVAFNRSTRRRSLLVICILLVILIRTCPTNTQMKMKKKRYPQIECFCPLSAGLPHRPRHVHTARAAWPRGERSSGWGPAPLSFHLPGTSFYLQTSLFTHTHTHTALSFFQLQRHFFCPLSFLLCTRLWVQGLSKMLFLFYFTHRFTTIFRRVYL